MKPLDKVAEAYYGGMGDQFSRRTRDRIHWICSKVEGETVLDIGCSQGIAELILAREGKKAVGIDIEESVIVYANEALQNQSDSVKRNVKYFVSSVFDYESKEKFDTVILTDVMEHFTSSLSLLQKVKSFLVENGTVIITVPFGIEDYVDHKRTYYMLNLLEEVEPYFEVKEIKFVGKWIGVVGRNVANSSGCSTMITRESIKRLEEAFYMNERSTVDKLNGNDKVIDQMNSIVNESREKLAILQKENEKLLATIAWLKTENKNLKQNESIRPMGNIKKESDQAEVGDFERTIEEKNKELLRRLDSEEQTLKKYRASIFDYNQLEAKYANTSKKYNLLSNAKLGRLTLKYWKLRRRIPEDF